NILPARRARSVKTANRADAETTSRDNSKLAGGSASCGGERLLCFRLYGASTNADLKELRRILAGLRLAQALVDDSDFALFCDRLLKQGDEHGRFPHRINGAVSGAHRGDFLLFHLAP